MKPSVAARTDLGAQNRRALLLPSALVLVAFVFAMYDTFGSLLFLWDNNAGYGHGLVLLGVSAYLLWLRREQIATVRSQTSVAGLLLSGGLIGVWFASRILGVLLGEQVVLILLVVSIVLALFGARMARIVALPILYLFCAVPIWSYLTPLLQDSTAQASTWMSRALGVPIYLEGVYMTIPDGVFLVAEVCAGISYLLAGLSLGAFYALLNLRHAWTRIGLVILAFGAGIVFNWVRVTGIVLIGHYSQMQHPLVKQHITYGWVLFVLVVIVVMVGGRLLEHVEERINANANASDNNNDENEAAAPDASEVPREGKRGLWHMAIVCAALLSVPAYAAMQLLTPPEQASVVRLSAQLGGAAGWHADAAAPRGDGWAASFQGPDSQTRARYRNAQQQVDVQVGYFAVQRQGAEAVNDTHAIFDKDDWRRVAQKVVAAQVSVAPGLVVNEVTIRHLRTSEVRLVWWWYWVDQQFTADRIEAKMLQIRSIFSGNHPAAIVVMSSPLSGDVEATRDGMKNWLLESAAGVAENLRAAAPPE